MSDLESLAASLRRRREIIGDHAWRDRDSAGHLEALKRISEEIEATGQRLGASIPKRLEHFLRQCSYDKALAFIEEAAPR